MRIFTYLDDGAGAGTTLEEAQLTSKMVQQDIKLSGFLAHKDKCQWDPLQCGELLGFVMDLQSGTFRVPERRVQSLRQALQDLTRCGFNTSARSLSRLTGLLVSMSLTVGPVVRLWTIEVFTGRPAKHNPGIRCSISQTRHNVKSSSGQRISKTAATQSGHKSLKRKY